MREYVTLASCWNDFLYRRNDLSSEYLKWLGLMHVAQAENGLIYAQSGESREVVYCGGRCHTAVAAIARDVQAIQRGLLNGLVRPPDGLAVVAQDVELALNLVMAQAREDVTGIAVLSDQAQRLLLARAADQNGRVRFLDGLRRVQWTL